MRRLLGALFRWLVGLFGWLEYLPKSALWIPYSYLVLGSTALWAIPLLDLRFEFGLDPRGYYWWSAVWVPLLAAGVAIALGLIRFVIALVMNRGSDIGGAALAGLHFVVIICGLPGAVWAWLMVLIIRFWVTRFFLAVAIANGLTAAALVVVALTTGEETNWTFIFIAMVCVVASLTGGYSWANQYGSGFIGASGILLAIILFLWGVWVWLFILAGGIVAVAAPFVLLWLLGFILTPGPDTPMFEPFWVNVVVIVLLTGFFAVAPWFVTLRDSSVAEMVTDDLHES